MQPLHVDQLIEGTHVIYTGRTSVDRVASSEPAEEGHILMEGHPGRISGVRAQHVYVAFLGLEDRPISSRGFARDDNGDYPGLAVPTEEEWERATRAGWWT
jgi:hypothetical protein